PEGVLIDWVQEAGLTPPALKRGGGGLEARGGQDPRTGASDPRARAVGGGGDSGVNFGRGRPPAGGAAGSGGGRGDGRPGGGGARGRGAMGGEEGGGGVGVHRTRQAALEAARQSEGDGPIVATGSPWGGTLSTPTRIWSCSCWGSPPTTPSRSNWRAPWAGR